MTKRLFSKWFKAVSFHGLFVPRTELFRSVIGEKNESIKQISGSVRKNFLCLEHGMTMERNDRIPFEETVVPRRWGSELRKFVIG